ncbi:MAG: CehA/McbA family metallohydrolase [Chitinispirillaceae bacterium]|nr:CehA/McbA family metallohydrolase [Chitinispirillaceae bacterium]
MQIQPELNVLTFIALYAETHFRFFRWFPSLLFSRMPEVLFDVPRRLGPGEDLPVLLMVNDVHRFPSELSGCAVVISRQREKPLRFDFPDSVSFELEHPLRRVMRAFIFTIRRTELPSGLFHVTCTVAVKSGGKRRDVVNDNLPSTGKLSFTCFAASDSLPGSEYCSYGDLHVHSQYSQSHVEFGPPLAAIKAMARASGLSFAAVTDHSYDLACSMDDYLASDQGLGRWLAFQRDIVLQTGKGVSLIPGEEVSCLNGKKKVVHLCGIGIKDYIPGTLDGARKKRRGERQLTIQEAVKAIHGQNGVAVAAHPGVKPGFFQKIFLSRGAWSEQDAKTGIDAFQIFNDGYTRSWYNGKSLWIKTLRQGHKASLAAGNDAHGDFNRYRALAVPFISVSENQGRYFGCGKTGVYGKAADASVIIERIREGNTFITTGPYVAISSSGSPADFVPVGRTAEGKVKELFIHAISTPEFGHIRSVELYGGGSKGGDRREKKVFTRYYDGTGHQACERIELSSLPAGTSYVRAEVSCLNPSGGSGRSAAFTGAVFLR